MIFTIENDKASAGIKQYGAELTSFKSKETGTEYLWQSFPEIWYGQSPVLFPIVGTLLDNKYRVDGKEYELFRHGIARKRDFELKEQGKDYVILTQKYNEDTLKVYPFKYILDIEFRLDGSKLTATHTVKNEDDGEMYFSIGAHPGFNCALGDKLEFEKEEADVVNEMIDPESILYDEKFPSPFDGKDIVITKDIFAKDALILSNLNSEKCTLKGEKLDADIEFTFGKCGFLGLWAKPGAPYVCIEPWYGVNDSRDKKADFSEKRAIQKISGDEEFSFAWSAEIKLK